VKGVFSSDHAAAQKGYERQHSQQSAHLLRQK
jgi:hypothetical protein